MDGDVLYIVAKPVRDNIMPQNRSRYFRKNQANTLIVNKSALGAYDSSCNPCVNIKE